MRDTSCRCCPMSTSTHHQVDQLISIRVNAGCFQTDRRRSKHCAGRMTRSCRAPFVLKRSTVLPGKARGQASQSAYFSLITLCGDAACQASFGAGGEPLDHADGVKEKTECTDGPPRRGGFGETACWCQQNRPSRFEMTVQDPASHDHLIGAKHAQ